MLENISGLLWGTPTVAALAVCGAYIGARTGFVQVRCLGRALRTSLGRVTRRRSEGGTSPLEAVCTALAGTVGTGNIAGVAVALSMGGAGAVLWMWVSALLGMGIKYAEIYLAVKYRERRDGEYVGGPMYYIKNGLGTYFRPLAVMFAVFGALASLGLGNMLQVGSVMTLAGAGAVIPRPVIGLVMAAAVALTCRGGAKGRGRTAALMVPVMAAVYVAGCLGVIGANLERLPAAVASIFRGALGGEAVFGGTAGAAVSWGFRRGLFSNEAGLGSSPIAHASAGEGTAEEAGLLGIFEVFVDTLLLCTLTALAVLTSGVEIPHGTPCGAELAAGALASVFGTAASGVFMAVSMTLFAFSSIVGWSLYGERCAQFLGGERAARAYRLLFPAVTAAASLVTFPAIISLSDIATFFMLLPNIIALCLLAGRVKKP